MNYTKFVGKTLKELAPLTGIYWKEIRVFLLEDKSDDTGMPLASGYSLHQIIAAYPAAADATVVYAYDFLGEIILRILAPKGGRNP